MSKLIIACMPVLGETPPVIGRISHCADCAQEIRVAPTTDEHVRAAGTPEHEFICTQCLFVRHQASDDGFRVESIPTPRQLKEMKALGIEWGDAAQRTADHFINLLRKSPKRGKR